MKVEHDYPVPKLQPGGVLVKNKYSGINFIDTYHRSGLYKRELPFIGGQEGGGFIAAVSPEAEAQGVKVGDRVAYSSVFQTYAEYTAVPANKVVTVPEEVPLDVAVSCGVQGMTAHYLTHSAHAGLVKPGEWMLIHGTGSGTCQWAAQMAKLRGYKVIGTCSESKQDIARATGVDELIVYKEAQGTSYEDYTSVDLVPKVMEITGGEGVKAVIDGIGLATARAGNVIGAGDFSDNRLIPDLVRGARNGQSVALRHPEAVRPWQHVLDALAGYLALAERLSDQPARYGQAWNFGPGRHGEWSVGRVADRVCRQLGGSWHHQPRAASVENPTLRLDSRAAGAALDWWPQLSIEETLDWTVQGYERLLRDHDDSWLADDVCTFEDRLTRTDRPMAPAAPLAANWAEAQHDRA